jgi:hypothetical protein
MEPIVGAAIGALVAFLVLILLIIRTGTMKKKIDFKWADWYSTKIKR